jgi:peptide/nickel transport system substrate-binding protein
MERTNYWTQRVGRRKFVAGAAAGGVGVAGLALTGCGDDDDDGNGDPTQPSGSGSQTPDDSAAKDAARKKSSESETLQVRHNQPFASINPWKGLDSGLTWCWWIYDHLFYTPFDTLKPELMLASSIEQVDNLTFNFKLKDSKFHNKAPINGRAVTALDVKASFEESKNQPGVSQTTFWSFIFDRIDAPDDKTLTVKLKFPYGWWNTTDGLSGPINGSIIPEEWAKDPNKMDTDLIGSQRYEFVSHQNGANFKMKRSTTWRNAPAAYISGIEYKLIQEQAAAIAAFQAGDIDSLGFNNKLEADQVKGQMGDKVDVVNEQSRSVWTTQVRGDGLYADPNVRKAFNLALDRDEIIDLLVLGDGVKSGPIPPSFGTAALTEAELEATYWKTDPGEAKKLLEAAAFPMDREIEIKFATLGDNFSKYAEIVAAQIKRNLGLNTKIVGEDLGTWLQQSLYGGDYKDVILYPTLAYESPPTYIIMYTESIGGRPNWGNYINKELSAAIQKADTTVDDEDRLQQYKDFQKMAIADSAPNFVTHVNNSYTGYQTYLKDRVTGRGSFGLFNDNLYIDKS